MYTMYMYVLNLHTKHYSHSVFIYTLNYGFICAVLSEYLCRHGFNYAMFSFFLYNYVLYRRIFSAMYRRFLFSTLNHASNTVHSNTHYRVESVHLLREGSNSNTIVSCGRDGCIKYWNTKR